MPRKVGKRARARARAAVARDFTALQLTLGDRIRVERRFVVEGRLTSVMDAGVFHGVQSMGSTEHVLLERQGEVHLIPLPSISEIVLEEAAQKRGPGAQGAFDPSFA